MVQPRPDFAGFSVGGNERRVSGYLQHMRDQIVEIGLPNGLQGAGAGSTGGGQWATKTGLQDTFDVDELAAGIEGASVEINGAVEGGAGLDEFRAGREVRQAPRSAGRRGCDWVDHRHLRGRGW
jgi:hypothetical protein